MQPVAEQQRSEEQAGTEQQRSKEQAGAEQQEHSPEEMRDRLEDWRDELDSVSGGDNKP